MTPRPPRKLLRCAIYTRKSTEHNLDLEFNSLDAQREACEAYIKSQAREGWRPVRTGYDDGGLSGASLDRPALQDLLDHVRGGKIHVIVVYKVDRLTRSLADFAKLVELFDQHSVSFVSVTQPFNTTSSMGRLTLNVLLSFAQFEREVIGERVRDKIAASKRKGLWVGGPVPFGYATVNKKLVIVAGEGAPVGRTPIAECVSGAEPEAARQHAGRDSISPINWISPIVGRVIGIWPSAVDDAGIVCRGIDPVVVCLLDDDDPSIILLLLRDLLLRRGRKLSVILSLQPQSLDCVHHGRLHRFDPHQGSTSTRAYST
jgi:DNA invertase Pin-like site-specific DNA recombinase